MIESNNPEIDVNQLMLKIQEEVAKRNNHIPKSFAAPNLGTCKINFSFHNVESLLINAESRAILRTKFPDKFDDISFPFASKIKQYCLKLFNFLFKDQREVNLNLINAFKESLTINRQLIAEIDSLRSQLNQNSFKTELADNIEDINYKIGVIDKNVKRLDENTNHLDNRLSKQENSQTISHLPNFVEFQDENYLGSAIALSNIPIEEHYKYKKQDLFYYLFENVFYNSAIVKEKQKHYLQYINTSLSSHPFLDAGCGRGEFIENLQLNNIKNQGIDLNQLEIEHLKQSGCEVYQSDILEFLEKGTDRYSGISALQVIEHFSFEYLNNFIKIAFDKLVMDGVIILETINPHCLYALSNFYQDPTHIKPLPPEMLKFLLEWHGFKQVKIIYSSLIPESLRVREQRMNYQDYALVGYKKL